MTNPGEERSADAGLVRAYVITGDTAVPDDGGLLLITLVTAADQPLPPSASPEKRRLWDLCSGGYLSVAEIAGHMRLPLGIVKILLSGLAADGHLLTRDAPPPAQHVDTQVLQEVLHGLRTRFG